MVACVCGVLLGCCSQRSYVVQEYYQPATMAYAVAEPAYYPVEVRERVLVREERVRYRWRTRRYRSYVEPAAVYYQQPAGVIYQTQPQPTYVQPPAASQPPQVLTPPPPPAPQSSRQGGAVVIYYN